jgi:hypothetical protein
LRTVDAPIEILARQRERERERERERTLSEAIMTVQFERKAGLAISVVG